MNPTLPPTTKRVAPVTLSVQEQFGQIDIYVFDQILRGNIALGMRVLDAGCGYGRNLVHLLREGCEVFALDSDPEAMHHVRQLSESLETGLPAENFRVGAIERMPFPDSFADVVMCNSVLHFARDERHFRAMLAGLWRALKPGGMLFAGWGRELEWTSNQRVTTYSRLATVRCGSW